MSETTLRRALLRKVKEWEGRAVDSGCSPDEQTTWAEAAVELRAVLTPLLPRPALSGGWSQVERPVTADHDAVTGGQILRWLSEHGHVHSIEGLCIKDTSGLCGAPAAVPSMADGRGIRVSATVCTCLLNGPHLEHIWWYTSDDGGHMITPTEAEKESGRYRKWLCPGRRI